MSPVPAAITIADGEITCQEAAKRLLLMTAAAWDLAATTVVEDDTPETFATQRLPITYPDAAKGLLFTPPNTIHQVTGAWEQPMADPKPNVT